MADTSLLSLGSLAGTPPEEAEGQGGCTCPGRLPGAQAGTRQPPHKHPMFHVPPKTAPGLSADLGNPMERGQAVPRAPKHRALEGTLAVGFSHPQLNLGLAV